MRSISENSSGVWRQRLATYVQSHPRLIPRLDITRLTWRVSGLAASLDGFTLAQVSDVHVGEGDWRTLRLQEAADALHDASPDLIVNTGDFLQNEPDVDRVIAELEPLLLAAPRAERFAILGNHDYYAGEAHVRQLKGWLTDLGMEILVNEVRPVARDGAVVTVAGLTVEEPGLEAAVGSLLESPRPRIALVHEPEVAERLLPGSVDLVLAGHTHGGQITVPFLEKAIVRKFCGSNYVEGLYEVSGNPLYVNRGLGCTGLPWRFRARPEVTIVQLRR